MQGFDFKEIQEKISDSFVHGNDPFNFGFELPLSTLVTRSQLLVAINFSQWNYHCRVISAATRARLLRSSSHSPRALNRAGHTFTHRSIGSLGCLVRRLDQARWIEHLSSTSNAPNHETYMAKF
ncbi:hypothetical protein Bca52824_083766 [Brassica carinata]|uniref:Uncharacterized protein n=1 Tax=Brassica carinata TaxID=52824 RepID=A0A8X7PM12_BRACI|nr:hypothetical protein Bca52824_083766 [Brassica carinata]